ncbi:MAG: OsmC family protein [Candidatus Sericytochromatia bacterium]
MPIMTYDVAARREDAHGSLAWTKQATITLDTDMAGRDDAFNPAELFLAAVAACMLKGIGRVTPMLEFKLEGVEVKLHGVREEKPPRIASISYELIVDTEESDRRLELLHDNIKKFGTIYNTVAAATELSGTIRRAGSASAGE